MKPVGFDWSDQKSARNRAKHGVSFEEATTVFDDDLAVTRGDPDHSVDERREIVIGHSDLPRLLFVSFTERNDVIRVISAREATKSEQKLYEEAIKRSR